MPTLVGVITLVEPRTVPSCSPPSSLSSPLSGAAFWRSWQGPAPCEAGQKPAALNRPSCQTDSFSLPTPKPITEKRSASADLRRKPIVGGVTGEKMNSPSELIGKAANTIGTEEQVIAAGIFGLKRRLRGRWSEHCGRCQRR